MVVGIIGGGASGMAAAITASRNPDVQVLLFERQARLGRKLQATGNGRCNLTNLYAKTQGYHGIQPDFAETALQKYDPEHTIDWFRSMGLFTVREPSGRVYPYSDQANSVVDILRFALDRSNIRVITGFEVSKLRRTAAGFSIENAEESYTCHKVIVACGGLAGTKLGGSLSGYKLLGKLGHHCTRLRPALVQLKSSWGGISGLKGVRTNCYVQILHDGDMHCSSTGELQFTEYGLSGPVIFEVSRDACQGTGEWVCCMDFLPKTAEEELYEELLRRQQTLLPTEEMLTGIVHNRLGRVLTKAAGVHGGRKISELKEAEIRAVCRAVKDLRVPLTEPLGMDAAQVTAGGIITSEFNSETMESNLVSGLFACGEVLDIDGDCGGYNLQWAWSSGRLAGYYAGKEDI